MRNLKNVLVSIWIILISILNKNFVYADVVAGPIEIITYSPLYYMAIIIVIAIVVGISIFILRKIYKSNRLQKDEENVKGDEK